MATLHTLHGFYSYRGYVMQAAYLPGVSFSGCLQFTPGGGSPWWVQPAHRAAMGLWSQPLAGVALAGVVTPQRDFYRGFCGCAFCALPCPSLPCRALPCPGVSCRPSGPTNRTGACPFSRHLLRRHRAPQQPLRHAAARLHQSARVSGGRRIRSVRLLVCGTGMAQTCQQTAFLPDKR